MIWFYILVAFNVIWILWIYNRQRLKFRERIEFASREELEQTLKSGDILLCRYESPATTRFMFGDEFSHAAIVYEDSRTGVKYVLEAAPNKTGDELMGNRPDGPVITPLWTRLSNYFGHVCVKRLNKPLDPERRMRFDRLVDEYHRTKTFDRKVGAYIKSCILVIGTDRHPNSVNCSMFIAQVIRDLDLVELTVQDVCMRPQCFADIYQHARMRDGYDWPGHLVELRIKK
jgi:hypothetical protein